MVDAAVHRSERGPALTILHCDEQRLRTQYLYTKDEPCQGWTCLKIARRRSATVS